MPDFRTGYLYSLSPIHCGAEGNIGNILNIAREVHTQFPFIPGSSLRGSLRHTIETEFQNGQAHADLLFGRELTENESMGVHQVWFGDARMLWVPMRTMAIKVGSNARKDVFTWVSCHSLIRDWAIISRQARSLVLPDGPVGTKAGEYHVADAKITVGSMSKELREIVSNIVHWPNSLSEASIHSAWSNSRVILPDADFQVLMEHSLWTQIRNKLADTDTSDGSTEAFWTDICIPRDTIFYFPWGYSIADTGTKDSHGELMKTMGGLIQVGGQANVGRGWLQGWVNNDKAPEVQQMPVEGA